MRGVPFELRPFLADGDVAQQNGLDELAGIIEVGSGLAAALNCGDQFGLLRLVETAVVQIAASSRAEARNPWSRS